MKIGDTSLGGSRAEFPETVLDEIRRAGEGSPAGLDAICRKYWKPAYHYFRVAWSKSNEDAKDLAQAFFLWLSDPKILQRFEPGRAAFRTFFKSLLRHFVQHQDEAFARLKRGGGRLQVEFPDGPAPTPGPEDAFEAGWRRSIIDQAVADVGECLKSVKFRVFERYYLSGERPTYDALAKEFGLSANDVQHHLAEVRAEVRRRIRDKIAEVTSGPEELEEEWHAFFGA